MMMTYDEGRGQDSDPRCSAGMIHHDALLFKSLIYLLRC